MPQQRPGRNWQMLSAAVMLGVGIAVISAVNSSGQEPKSKADQNPAAGCDDRPFLPGQKWRVHDINRLHPGVVTPGTASTEQRTGRPPADAIVLFDGRDLSKWTAQKRGKAAMVTPGWTVQSGYMEVVAGPHPCRRAGGSDLRTVPAARECSAEAGQVADLRHRVRAAAVRGPELIKPAYVTVFYNGVLVHHHQEIVGRMAHRQVGTYEPHGPEEPLMLQDHRRPVHYRNIWVRRLAGYDQP